MAKPAWPVLLALSSIPLVPLAAHADSDGSSGGGGRLGAVSSGLATAAATGGGGGGGGGVVVDPGNVGTYYDRYNRYDAYSGAYGGEPVYVTGAGGASAAGSSRTSNPVRVDFYVGAQKVYESDGSFSAELAFNEGRFRLGGAVSRYYERQQGQDALTFTVPSLYIGFRVDDGGPTRVYVEAGAAGARTNNDPVMDSSVSGFLGGVRVEHAVSPRVSVLGDAQAMVFEQDVKATAARLGVRYGHFQATVRYLDLNVGPALFGPEVGIRF
jgi:hypothetical protein